MPVYFAYRSFDHGPTGKYLRRFEDDTVLGWFRRHWEHLAVEDADEADRRLTEVLGCDGWFLWNPFRTAAAGLPCPKSGKALTLPSSGLPRGRQACRQPALRSGLHGGGRRGRGPLLL